MSPKLYCSASRCTLAKATDQHHEHASPLHGSLLATSAACFGPSALKVRSFWMDYSTAELHISCEHIIMFSISLVSFFSYLTSMLPPVCFYKLGKLKSYFLVYKTLHDIMCLYNVRQCFDHVLYTWACISLSETVHMFQPHLLCQVHSPSGIKFRLSISRRLGLSASSSWTMIEKDCSVIGIEAVK